MTQDEMRKAKEAEAQAASTPPEPGKHQRDAECFIGVELQNLRSQGYAPATNTQVLFAILQQIAILNDNVERLLAGKEA